MMVSMSLGLCFIAAVAAAAPAPGPEIRATAVFALGRDPSGQKAATMTHALLRKRVLETRTLRLVEPGRVLSGDPRTREEATLERARAALADGRRAYDALALDDAIARLGQSVSLYQEAGPLLGDLTELRTALQYLAAALVLRGSADEAESTFVELLTVDPSHQLVGFPPTVERIFERAAARIDATASGSVEIYSTPPYAAVYLDGRFEGVTPLVLDDVVAGTHYLRLEKLGYVVHGAPLQIAPKQRITSQTRLSSLSRGAELRDLAARSVEEVNGRAMGGHTRELARVLVADTIIFVAVTQSGRDAAFEAAVYDARAGTRIATERAVLSADAATFTERLGRYLDRAITAARTGQSVGPPPSPSEGPAFGLGAGPRPAPARTSGFADPSFASASGSSRPTPGEIYLGWTFVGVGGVALLTGVGFGVAAQITHDDFRQTAQLSPDLPDIQNRGQTYSVVADGLMIGGGVLLAGGAALVIIGDMLSTSTTDRLSEAPPSKLEPFVGAGPDGAVVGLGGRF